jgi:hypothetical protein
MLFGRVAYPTATITIAVPLQCQPWRVGAMIGIVGSHGGDQVDG